ncbi:ribosome biogenesis GTPase YlqF [Alicyclobacillus sp.]|uniref:ribosome biogenesis GTPase YlqF n=1 Tax=Alicyclobacillus sp. TaxID=61169 RepID=UPI0025BE9344|nr:ribosome biogenesis GTPase YlqF [Alicyclobacillus sp.]MCL6515658.1 ribosome biogenesis GTPase YlqF [Alicyclobacillus sp.]
MEPIHWFPGHMAKAKRQMEESLRRVDAVLELVDARLPAASRNPMLRQMLGARPKVVVMTRIDLADPRATAAWTAHLGGEGYPVVLVDAKSGRGVHEIVPALEEAARALREKEARRGIRPRPLRAMVVGIPNVGKSSLINRLAGRAAARIGDRPGITQTPQWVRLGQVELLDTPGVLWPKLEDQRAALALAVSGAIKAEVVDRLLVAAYFVVFASRHYPTALVERYGVEPAADTSSLESLDTGAVWRAAEPVLNGIAQRRGLRRGGGAWDEERAADLLLREVQTGKLGRLSFEWPPERDENSPQVDGQTGPAAVD